MIDSTHCQLRYSTNWRDPPSLSAGGGGRGLRGGGARQPATDGAVGDEEGVVHFPGRVHPLLQGAPGEALWVEFVYFTCERRLMVSQMGSGLRVHHAPLTVVVLVRAAHHQKCVSPRVLHCLGPAEGHGQVRPSGPVGVGQDREVPRSCRRRDELACPRLCSHIPTAEREAAANQDKGGTGRILQDLMKKLLFYWSCTLRATCFSYLVGSTDEFHTVRSSYVETRTDSDQKVFGGIWWSFCSLT